MYGDWNAVCEYPLYCRLRSGWACERNCGLFDWEDLQVKADIRNSFRYLFDSVKKELERFE